MKYVQTLTYFNVLIISAINGPAIGAGLCLAQGGCDIRIASISKASMGFTFNRLGLHPGMGALHFAPLLIGPETRGERGRTGSGQRNVTGGTVLFGAVWRWTPTVSRRGWRVGGRPDSPVQIDCTKF